MPVTYLIWDAALSSTHLTAAHTDSTLLHTSMMLAPPEEDEKEERKRKKEQRIDRNMKYFFVYVAQMFISWIY